MEKFKDTVAVTPDLTLGGNVPFLIAGPCAVENEEICLQVAQEVKALAQSIGFGYVFKASFDKANRTSASSFRSIGFDKAMGILQKVKDQVQVPVLTDVHETGHVNEVAQVVDVLQIPAFLCRQTDLLQAAARTNCTVNIKRGQFMAPEDMRFAVEKVTEQGNHKVSLTERGASFGYHNLVVDMRSLPTMRQYCPVIFDVTHSVQQPGGLGGKSGGQRQFAPYLARAAAAAGVDGFFIETHPEPAKALSDGPNMVPLAEMKHFLSMLYTVWTAARPFV